jgi:ABC-type multidrug transport system ATPase subunit
MSAIRISNLSLVARGRLLLEGFSLQLAAGEKCSLTGSSGSGKTTLLRCLMGFSTPAAGDIELFGQPLSTKTVWGLRQKMAWVAQEPELGDGTAREALQRPLAFRANRNLETSPKRMPELVLQLRLEPELLDQPVAKLSGGEKQRVAILAALLLERPILLLDEASSALDPTARDAVTTVLNGLDRTTILSVSHDPASFPVGDRVVKLPREGVGNGTS